MPSDQLGRLQQNLKAAKPGQTTLTLSIGSQSRVPVYQIVTKIIHALDQMFQKFLSSIESSFELHSRRSGFGSSLSRARF